MLHRGPRFTIAYKFCIEWVRSYCTCRVVWYTFALYHLHVMYYRLRNGLSVGAPLKLAGSNSFCSNLSIEGRDMQAAPPPPPPPPRIRSDGACDAKPATTSAQLLPDLPLPHGNGKAGFADTHTTNHEKTCEESKNDAQAQVFYVLFGSLHWFMLFS